MARAPRRRGRAGATAPRAGMGRLWLRRLQQLFGRQLQVEQRLLRPLLAASNPAAKRSKTSTSGFMADSSDEASDEGDNPEQEDTDELTAYLEVEQANSSRSRRPTPSRSSATGGSPIRQRSPTLR